MIASVPQEKYLFFFRFQGVALCVSKIISILSFNGDGFGQLPGKTARTHQYAKVANYQGQPFVVGGSESGNKYSKVSKELTVYSILNI